MDIAPIIRILSGPLIGAVIGYFTNMIAVKMLFYPKHGELLVNYSRLKGVHGSQLPSAM